MSQKSSGPLSKFNLALALLWLVDVVVTGAGYLILTSSNATQADFYTSQSSDYVTYFSAQTGSTLGATLIGAGVLGFIITLAAHAVSWSITRAAAVTPADAVDVEPDFDDDEEFDGSVEETGSTDAPAGKTATPPAITTAPATPAAGKGDEPQADAPKIVL